MESMTLYRREAKLRFGGVGIEEIGEDGAAESGCAEREKNSIEIAAPAPASTHSAASPLAASVSLLVLAAASLALF
ncbi:hypothetical protein SASPL_148856 [Salvia splendens]|uniref:Uncharacterized protein n=1 Tax=Salvia splendens TaxID=180675 RepID=A0A8X8Z3T1_SALSN|nr:hypothetical protein SASPL_148856 [Salvia splendens]